MKSFHNDPAIKSKYIARIKKHMKTNTIIQKYGYINGIGGAIGCTLENYDMSRYPIELGIPEWVSHLEDIIFEKISEKESKTFPLEFLESIPVGIEEKEFEKLSHTLSIQRLEILLFEQKKFFLNDKFGINNYIQQTILYHKNPNLYTKPSTEIKESTKAIDSRLCALEAAIDSGKSHPWSARYACDSYCWHYELSRSESVKSYWRKEKNRLLSGLTQLSND